MCEEVSPAWRRWILDQVYGKPAVRALRKKLCKYTNHFSVRELETHIPIISVKAELEDMSGTLRDLASLYVEADGVLNEGVIHVMSRDEKEEAIKMFSVKSGGGGGNPAGGNLDRTLLKTAGGGKAACEVMIHRLACVPDLELLNLGEPGVPLFHPGFMIS